MTPDFRAMCAELVELCTPVDSIPQLAERLQKLNALADRARALLAEAEAEGPSLSDVTELFYRRMGEGSEIGFEDAIAEALARWGHPTPQPVAEGPRDEDSEKAGPRYSTLQTTPLPPGPWTAVSVSINDDSTVSVMMEKPATQSPAQPEPEGLTDEELLRTYGIAKRDHCYEGDLDDWPKKSERAATVAGIRAVLSRWGRPAAAPVPEPGEVPRIGHILRLAEIIREVDGRHDKGAAALAEAILSHPGICSAGLAALDEADEDV